MNNYSAAGSYNFRCVQQILLTSLSSQQCCHIALKFLPSGFLISLLPQDKQFTEAHVVTSYMIYNYAFLILVICPQSSLLENTILRTMVASDSLFDNFYINLNQFYSEMRNCGVHQNEFVEQV